MKEKEYQTPLMTFWQTDEIRTSIMDSEEKGSDQPFNVDEEDILIPGE